MEFLRFCPWNWGTRKRVDTAPKASGCFLGGTQEIFAAVSEDLLGGTGKAEDAKLPGAGIIPKLCPMERVGTETTRENKPRQSARTGATKPSSCQGAKVRAYALPEFGDADRVR